MMHTEVSVDKINEDDRTIYLLDVDPNLFQSYVDWLEGKVNFEWNEQVAELFDYMGHVNWYHYPLDYWKIKLIDMHTPTLISLPIMRQRLSLYNMKHNEYIVGPPALFVSNIISTQPECTTRATIDSTTDLHDILRNTGELAILHNSQVVTTIRGKHAIENKTIWFDPDCYSQYPVKYTKMLLMYNRLGFTIQLPPLKDSSFIDPLIGHEDKIMDLFMSYTNVSPYESFMERLNMVNECHNYLDNHDGALMWEMLEHVKHYKDYEALKKFIKSNNGTPRGLVDQFIRHNSRMFNFITYSSMPYLITTNSLMTQDDMHILLYCNRNRRPVIVALEFLTHELRLQPTSQRSRQISKLLKIIPKDCMSHLVLDLIFTYPTEYIPFAKDSIQPTPGDLASYYSLTPLIDMTHQ